MTVIDADSRLQGDESPSGTGKGPSFPLYATEGARALWDVSFLAATAPFLRLAPSGDGHDVLVLPGFLASDSSTTALRRFLRRKGYRPHGWQLGRNPGPTPAIVEGLWARLNEIAARASGPVSLVGWSLGGIYARELARAHPDAVRQVITMGSPFRITATNQSRAAKAYQRLAGSHLQNTTLPLPEEDREPFPVPATSIFSKADGVVAWQTCLDMPGSIGHNVEVYGSHLGLGFNATALWVVADRLAQPSGRPQTPFEPPLLLRGLFPST